VNNPGSALTDYQVYMVMSASALGLRPDCADIRVWAASPRQQLSFWLHEDDCGAASVRLWVLVPSLPAASTVQLDIFTGCPQCSTALSSPGAVFPDGFHVFTEPNFRDFILGMQAPAVFNDSAGGWTLPGGAYAGTMLPMRSLFTLAPGQAVEFGFRHVPTNPLPDCPAPLFYFADTLTRTLGGASGVLRATCTSVCADAACVTCPGMASGSSTARSSPTFSVAAGAGTFELRHRLLQTECKQTLTRSFVSPRLYVHTNDTNPQHSAHLRWAAHRKQASSDPSVVVGATQSSVVLVEAIVPPFSANITGSSTSLVEVSQNGVYYPTVPASPDLQSATWRPLVVATTYPARLVADSGVVITIVGTGARTPVGLR
jgi:hypothetical protein